MRKSENQNSNMGPKQLHHHNLELEAYKSGNREALLELVLTDPFTRSLDQANGLVEGILKLPFHKEMRAHFK